MLNYVAARKTATTLKKLLENYFVRKKSNSNNEKQHIINNQLLKIRYRFLLPVLYNNTLRLCVSNLSILCPFNSMNFPATML